MALRDKSFDSVIGAFFLHHNRRARQPTAVQECYRVISRGHLIVVAVSQEWAGMCGT